MNSEDWDWIAGYEGLYKVSTLGRVKSFKRGSEGTVLKNYERPKGYLSVTLYKESRKSEFLVHRLVAETFIPNININPCVNHKNGIKVDNRVINLEWCTYKYNNKHARDSGLNNITGSDSPSSKLKGFEVVEICRKLDEGLTTQVELGRMYGVSPSTVSRINTGVIWNHLTNRRREVTYGPN